MACDAPTAQRDYPSKEAANAALADAYAAATQALLRISTATFEYSGGPFTDVVEQQQDQGAFVVSAA
jgi:hypothetical protein